MLKLNKNSRNMCCALAVAAVFFIIVKCMKSEGFKKQKCTELPELTGGICGMGKKWIISGSSMFGAEPGTVYKTVPIPTVEADFKALLRECKKNPKCHSIITNSDTNKVQFTTKPPVRHMSSVVSILRDGNAQKRIKQIKSSIRSKRQAERVERMDKAVEEEEDDSSDN